MLPNDECGLCTTSEWLVNSSTGGLLKDSLLKAYDVDGELLYLLQNYPENCKQRVALNGQTTEWREINYGVPQGSVLGLLLFLIYINDLPDGMTSICKVFADDTNLDLEKVSECGFQWKILILINRLMKSYFLENQNSILIPLSLSRIMILRNVLIRNI